MKTKTNALGEKALEYISDYPLYASSCNITYEQAIRVAYALNPQWQAEMREMERFNKLTPEQQKAELEKM